MEKIYNKQEGINISILQEMSELLQKGRAPQVKELVQQAIDAGIPPKGFLEEGFLSG